MLRVIACDRALLTRTGAVTRGIWGALKFCCGAETRGGRGARAAEWPPECPPFPWASASGTASIPITNAASNDPPIHTDRMFIS